ncbi:MAG: DeoR/GlpR family DNA-binding transcription regulator [Sporolactobacillus sp.]|jgi:DeoR family lactose phosphotransferase system repressor|nr:DeoR/GlpR family DNA-binding transcription regulator [Sporolactobacillus sp.]MCI1881314.1 DeoR/GlpR family DNA-binding transcription regulator [Sporolactobacillus sp.]
MLKSKRQEAILSMLDTMKVVEVGQLAKDLQVTEMTIRRDLKELEEKGQLVRVHGGAKKTGFSSYTVVSHAKKAKIHVNEKKVIAKKCADLIKEHDVIFLGSGTTIEYIIDELADLEATFITNSLSIFNRLQSRNFQSTLLIGGRYRHSTDTFYGVFANEMIRQIKVGKAFIGTNGIAGVNVTTTYEDEGESNKLILNNSEHRYVVSDYSKLDISALYTFYNLKNIDALITDNKINPTQRAYYEKFTKVM